MNQLEEQKSQLEEQNSQLKRLNRQESWIEEMLRTRVIKDIVWSAISPADNSSNKFRVEVPGQRPHVFFDHPSSRNDKAKFTEFVLEELRKAGWNG
jgi:hypothetical protein